jgi:hypothetical protein
MNASVVHLRLYFLANFIVRQAFPVRDVFDDALFDLFEQLLRDGRIWVVGGGKAQIEPDPECADADLPEAQLSHALSLGTFFPFRALHAFPGEEGRPGSNKTDDYARGREEKIKHGASLVFAKPNKDQPRSRKRAWTRDSDPPALAGSAKWHSAL